LRKEALNQQKMSWCNGFQGKIWKKPRGYNKAAKKEPCLIKSNKNHEVKKTVGQGKIYINN